MEGLDFSMVSRRVGVEFPHLVVASHLEGLHLLDRTAAVKKI